MKGASDPPELRNTIGADGMTQDQRRLAQLLTYCGILPPWLALGLHLGFAWQPAGFAALTYGAIIASFLCGVHWGLFMQATRPMPFNLLLTSNAGALAAWAMLLVSLWSPALAFVGVAMVLGVLLLIDRRLLSLGVIEPWFWTIRRNASIGLGAGLIVWSLLA